MKVTRYFLLLGFGAIATAALYAGFFFLQLGVAVPNGMSRWSAELNRQKLDIASKKGSGKIVIVGGSSSLFGIRAEIIEEQTKRPTVNLGAHAALGAAYLLHNARKALANNDVVILALEYELFNERYYPNNQEYLDYIIGHDTEFFANMPLRSKGTMMLQLPLDRLKQGVKYRFKQIKPRIDPPGYAITNLNAHGDLLRADPLTTAAARFSITNMTSDLARGIAPDRGSRRAITEFVEWCHARNIKVLATFPPLFDRPIYHDAEAKNNAKEIETLYQGVGVPMLENYTTCLLPLSEFYDTAYHLTADAAQRRTVRLLQSLLPHLD